MTSPATRRPATRRPALESLEERLNLSLYTYSFSGGVLTVWSNSSASDVDITGSASSATVADSTNNWSITRSGVTKVQVIGGASNDDIRNYISTMPVNLWGQGGNDYLEGYGGNDNLYGGDGNDTIKAYGGNDSITGGAGNDWVDCGSGNDYAWGEAGNDILLGGTGNDKLIGGDNNDRLNGGSGVDYHWGGNGDDVIVSIDNYTSDTAQGDAGRDVIWTDQTGLYYDSAPGLTTSDVVKRVASFRNGADRTLNGDGISDPTVHSGKSYKTFSGNPLFSSAGPKVTDLDQGGVGDCWLLAGLGAIAIDGGGPSTYTKQHVLRQRIVDFDDGTYGVQLAGYFYRVDNQLPVNSPSSTTPAYAKLGAQSSMWVAVAEKAFAYYRYGTNSYVALDGGWSYVVNAAFGSTAWGEKTIASYSSGSALLSDLRTKWLNYQAATIGFTSIGGGAPLVDDHMYTVHSFTYSGGVLSGVILRNPWGSDGAGSDGNNDGLVTVTAAQLRACVGRVNWGKVAV